jgi:hypothetical protein
VAIVALCVADPEAQHAFRAYVRTGKETATEGRARRKRAAASQLPTEIEPHFLPA